MPKAVYCTYENGRLGVLEALELRSRARRDIRVRFSCLECGHPVRPHRAGSTGQAAHFEHFKRNPRCPLSDPAR